MAIRSAADATYTFQGMQAHNRYLITESEDGVLVIDQHALHERILYERFREKVLSGRLEVQRLLVPSNLTGNIQQDLEKSSEVWDNKKTGIGYIKL